MLDVQETYCTHKAHASGSVPIYMLVSASQPQDSCSSSDILSKAKLKCVETCTTFEVLMYVTVTIISFLQVINNFGAQYNLTALLMPIGLRKIPQDTSSPYIRTILMFIFLLYFEEGGIKCLRNIFKYRSDHTASHSRKHHHALLCQWFYEHT